VDGEVIDVSAEEQLQLRVLCIKNRNLQKQKEILEAKCQRVSAQAKVRQMIRDEEQRARELEQEIAIMQREGQHDLQHGPPLQQRAPAGDLFIPQRGPFCDTQCHLGFISNAKPRTIISCEPK
jgi:hypothetical protein